MTKYVVFVMALLFVSAAPGRAGSLLVIQYLTAEVDSYPTKYCQAFNYGEAVRCGSSDKNGSEVKFFKSSFSGKEHCTIKFRFDNAEKGGNWHYLGASGACKAHVSGDKIIVSRH